MSPSPPEAGADAPSTDRSEGATGGLRFWWRCIVLAGLALILLALTWWDGHRATGQPRSAIGSHPAIVVPVHD